jgi:hypothetical protein
MSASSKIEWTDATWNLMRGYTKVNPGCKHCYAEIKLHQFLMDVAKDQLRDHISKITVLLQISHNTQEFLEHFAALFGGERQLKWGDFDVEFS